jgi:protein tyrosine phosphatase (PTP) superfamily phosphohydrolase (DUF442 family)
MLRIATDQLGIGRRPISTVNASVAMSIRADKRRGAAAGIRHIINLGLHSHEKALPDEAASVSRLGMTYIHIPVDFQNPTDGDFAQFCSAMEQLKEVPVHVHCIANYRVSAFLYRYRREVLGTDEAQARADMEQVWQPKGVWAAFVGR